MCGIIAVLGDLGKKQQTIAEQLLFADTFRGYDSTGVVSVKYNGAVHTFKRAVPAPDFLDFKQWDSLKFGKGLIGHNRWKTKGAINNRNAHPFTHGKFHGVHNGTLRQQGLLPDFKDFDVDSENIYHSFNKIGVDKTLELLNGAYALAWYNEEEEVFQFIRNNERPLSYAVSADGKNVYVASEEKMLEWILGRNGVQYKAIINTTPHHLYSFKLPEKVQDKIEVSVQKKGFYTPPVQAKKAQQKTKGGSNVTRYDRFLSRGKNHREEATKFLNKTFEFTVGKKISKGHYGRDYYTLIPDNFVLKVGERELEVRCLDSRTFKDLELAKKSGMLVEATLGSYLDDNYFPNFVTVYSKLSFIEPEVTEDILELYEGYEGAVLTEGEWKKATKKGCAWCSSPAVIDEKNVFIAEDEFICECCSSLPLVKDYLEISVH